MLNWEMELKKFAPAFKILTYFGSQKERRLKRQGLGFLLGKGKSKLSPCGLRSVGEQCTMPLRVPLLLLLHLIQQLVAHLLTPLAIVLVDDRL